MKTAKQLELDLLVKECKIQQLKRDYNKEIERLKEEYMMLQNASEEVEEGLQQRINKAIEYIAKHNNYFLLKREVKELVNILKGVDKE